MPGILPQSENTQTVSLGVKMTVGSQQGVSYDVHREEGNVREYRNGDVLTNGVHEHVNGVSANGDSMDSSLVQAQTSDAIEEIVGQLPPEIEHITFGYVPLHSLITRLVQETFNGLTETINEMSSISNSPSDQQTHLNRTNQFVNGTGDTSGANIQKKLRMLNFTSGRRAQFIKILVLLRWAHQAEAVSKVIDLNVWTGTRLQEYKDCISWMGELKRNLVHLRDPNPDIKTALEVLTLGKASWLPDLGYLSPEPLSARHLLSALRRINTLLSTRLNLHEEIPPAMREFSIGSGRVTFRVPEEFEVDLSMAEEDSSSQLYFIDFRFNFSPSKAKVQASTLRDLLEGEANAILRQTGLAGLFEFLHNFTLTHKLSVLRNQAYDMARGYWSEQLQVEAVHRSIVIQYWTNRPGGKNWLEIGLKRGQRAAFPCSLKTQRIPNIGVRWFRSGKEVSNFRITLRLHDLSLAYILKQVIALHTSYTFEQIAAKLKESTLYSEGSLRLIDKFSATEPIDASLLLQLTPSKAIKIVQEPVSGRFSILPASHLHYRVEHELNRLMSPATEGASHLAHLRSLTSQEEVDLGARKMGWEPLRSLNPNRETTQRLFGQAVQAKKFFKKSTWSTSWILAFTTSLEGDHWWILELSDKDAITEMATSKSNDKSTLHSAYEVLVPMTKSRVIKPSFETLTHIENTAASMICQFIDARTLQASEYPHKVQAARQNDAKIQPGGLLIRIPSRISPSATESSTESGGAWLDEVVRLNFCGLDPSKQYARHIARVRTQQALANLQNLLSKIPSLTFEPNSEGMLQTLRFHFLTQIGHTVISSLESRLKAVNLLLDLAATLQSHRLPCSASSLTRLIFQYTGSNPPLKAAIHFSSNASKNVTLSQPNPHLRIVDFITTELRTRGLVPLLGILRLTLPLLGTFSSIEANPDGAGINVLTRSDQWYQIRYSKPFSKSGFDVRLKGRRDDVMWLVPEHSVKRPENIDEAFEKDLRAVMRGKGDGWRGVNGGMIASITGVQDLVINLDRVFRMSRHVVGESGDRKRKAEDEAVVID